MKKGFTLIEIMGVIILLGLISVIVVPVVDELLKESKNKVLNEQLNNIYKSAKNWGIKNSDKLPDYNEGRVLIKISTLKKEGFLENKPIKNPVNQQELNACVEIVYDESFKQYDYNYVEDCTPSFAVMTSTNTCIYNTTTPCTVGDTKIAVTVKLNSNTTGTFYVIGDTGTELTLIMDRNIGNKVAWISQADYEAAGGTNYDTNGNNEKGPLTALTYLESQTSGWTNIPTMSYILSDDGGGTRYQPITRTNVRARMLTKTEATTLDCTSTANSCKSYLYTNTSNSNTAESPFGYRLSSAYSGETYFTWGVIYNGSINYGNSVSSINSLGVRPVIKIPKTMTY